MERPALICAALAVAILLLWWLGREAFRGAGGVRRADFAPESPDATHVLASHVAKRCGPPRPRDWNDIAPLSAPHQPDHEPVMGPGGQ